MIELVNVSARAGTQRANGVTLRLDAGLHALVGHPEDGPLPLLATIAGAMKPRKGTTTLDGHATFAADARKTIGYVPRDPKLPLSLTVHETLKLAWTIRGLALPQPKAALEQVGCVHLADRMIDTLSRAERRSVSLAEAMGAGVRLLCVAEPLSDIEGAARVRDVFRACVARGSTVVVATASLRDAEALGAALHMFDKGTFVRTMHAADEWALGERPAFRLFAPDARAVATLLADHEDVRAVALDESGSLLRVSGHDWDKLASTIASAVAQSRVSIQSLAPESASITAVHAALAGDAQRASRVALERAQRPQEPPHNPGEGSTT